MTTVSDLYEALTGEGIGYDPNPRLTREGELDRLPDGAVLEDIDGDKYVKVGDDHYEYIDEALWNEDGLAEIDGHHAFDTERMLAYSPLELLNQYELDLGIGPGSVVRVPVVGGDVEALVIEQRDEYLTSDMVIGREILRQSLPENVTRDLLAVLPLEPRPDGHGYGTLWALPELTTVVRRKL